MDFYHSSKNIKKKLIDAGLDASKKAAHKAGEYLGNEIADVVLSKTLAMRTNSTDDKIEKQEPVEEIIIPPEKRKEILSKLRKVL